MSLRIQSPSATSATSSSAPASSSLHVEQTRIRTTRRAEGFGTLLRTGADVVLRGVETGTTALLGPIAGAAVRQARIGVAPGPLGEAPSSEQTTIDQMRELQTQSQTFNMQYMALQEEVQQENRRFSTVSNVLKAKHETAKSAIGNIRS